MKSIRLFVVLLAPAATAMIVMVGACRESKSSAPSTGANVAAGGKAGTPGTPVVPARPGMPGTPDGTGDGANPTPANPTPAAAPDAAPVAQRPEPQEREGGPTRAVCEQLADRLATFVVDSMLPADADAEKRAYVEKVAKNDRPNVLRFCLESATPEEAACVVKATDYPTLAACERFRRQVPKDLASRDEVTTADCEKLYERLRQFKIDEGVAAAEIEQTKDQVVRACEEKAKPGTVACFIASRSYEEARRCP